MQRKKMKTPKQEYTAAFKELSVQSIKEGMTTGMLSKELSISDADPAQLDQVCGAG